MFKMDLPKGSFFCLIQHLKCQFLSLPTRHHLHKINDLPVVQSSLMLSASLLLCGEFLQTSNTYLEIHQKVALPPSVCQRNHKLRSMCRSQRMRLSLERQVLNRAGWHAFPPLRPAEPAGFSAPGCLVYFYKRCLSSEYRSSCNFGSSIRLCVCLFLSWGGRRLWLLTTSTD